MHVKFYNIEFPEKDFKLTRDDLKIFEIVPGMRDIFPERGKYIQGSVGFASCCLLKTPLKSWLSKLDATYNPNVLRAYFILTSEADDKKVAESFEEIVPAIRGSLLSYHGIKEEDFAQYLSRFTEGHTRKIEDPASDERFIKDLEETVEDTCDHIARKKIKLLEIYTGISPEEVRNLRKRLARRREEHRVWF